MSFIVINTRDGQMNPNIANVTAAGDDTIALSFETDMQGVGVDCSYVVKLYTGWTYVDTNTGSQC